MNTTIQSTLLGLMEQVIEDPDHIPIIPLDVWSEGTEQQHLLSSFRDMLERLQQHHQNQLEAQERFSLAVQGANDGLWVQHLQTNQALYGISLGVHTARLQLDHNPGELAESLDYVLELAEAALTEMRALIFELRPESLEAEGLITALTKQTAALHARHNIVVSQLVKR